MDLFELNGRVVVNLADALAAFEEIQKSGEKTESKLSKFFGAIGKGALTLGKWTVAGIGAATTAIAGVTVKALNAAGELEQNMGGAESVFKELGSSIGEMSTTIITGYDESTGKAITAVKSLEDVSKNAFKNMGLSQSDYLATANKMGALFQGAGFETQEALDLSSQAMQRAADVASIMGIDTASAMEAVAGAAKGNFTMMDNLGVAMNDTTLNAYALEKGLGKTTSEMSNQEKISLAMELFMEKTAYAAGNYAKENETLAGSLGTAKAALTNFLSGAGTVEDVVSSFSSFANVIVKNIDSMFPSLMTGMVQIVEQLVPMIPPLLDKLLPSLIEGATSLINGVVAALPAVLDALMNALPSLIQGVQTIINALISALPSLMQSLMAALPTLLPQIITAIISIIVTLCEMLPQIIQPIIDNLPTIIIAIVEALVQNLPALIEGVISLVMGIVEQTPVIIKSLIDAIPTITEMVVTALLENLPALIMGLIQVVMGIVRSLPEILSSLRSAFPKAMLGIWNGVMNVFSNAGEWFGKIFKGAKEKATQAWSDVKAKFSNIKNGITNVFSNIGSWFKEKFTNAKNNVHNAWSGVKNFFSNIKNGIVNAFSNIKEKLSAPFTKARDAIRKVADKIKGFFKGEISMPKIKLPHFKISPSGWRFKDLLEGEIPKLGIEWYAKAMDNPMVMTKPTIFGYNAESGKLQGGGEVPGGEMIGGTNTIMNMISEAVASQNNAIAQYLQHLIEILGQFFPQVLELMEKDIVLDDGTLVGRLTPQIDKQLAIIQKRKDRGR